MRGSCVGVIDPIRHDVIVFQLRLARRRDAVPITRDCLSGEERRQHHAHAA
jgi:hypothetical protein